MTVAAIIECDLGCNPLGLASHALDEIGDQTVLARTADRLLRCEAIDAVGLAAPADQHDRLRAALGGRDVALFDLRGDDIPSRPMLRRARKWSLSGWRGGLIGATIYDAFGHPGLAAAAEQMDADVIVPVPAEWPWIDSALVDEIVRHHLAWSLEPGLTLSQAPPGLLPAVHNRDRFAAWCEEGAAVADLLRYDPDKPRADIVVQPSFFQVPGDLLRCEHRFTADTDRGMALARAILASVGPDATAHDVVRAVAEHPAWWPGPTPREVVLEITTRRPVEDALRPLPPIDGAELSLDDACTVLRQIGRADDTLLTLAGRGDPLLHPNVGAIIAAAREAGVFGVHLVTYGRHLTPDLARTCVEAGVDVITFLLDAHTPEAYARFKGGADLADALEGIATLSRARRAADADWPLVAVAFVKTRDTLPEMEAFYDTWMRRGATPVICGPSDLAGRVADVAVVSMAPPRRTPCRRLFRRLAVLADGRAPSCEEDVLCRQPLGEAGDLAAAWSGEALGNLRRAHLVGRFEDAPLCARCREWHRP